MKKYLSHYCCGCGLCQSLSKAKLLENEKGFYHIDDGDTEFDTDDYGDHLTACPIADVIAYLEEKMEVDSYRRLRLLYGLLTGIEPEKWDHLELVHFGY